MFIPGWFIGGVVGWILGIITVFVVVAIVNKARVGS